MRDQKPILAASAVIRNGDGDYLSVQRANPPEQGRWTLPGGHVGPGETIAQAAIREVREEPGLMVRIIRPLGQLHVPDRKAGLYEIRDFLAEKIGGEMIAGDDAAAVGWFGTEP